MFHSRAALIQKKKLTWKPFLFVSKTKQVYNFFIIFFILIKQLTVFIGLFNVRHSCFKWIFFTLWNIKFWGQNIRILEVPVFFEAINFTKNLSKKKRRSALFILNYCFLKHFEILLAQRKRIPIFDSEIYYYLCINFVT